MTSLDAAALDSLAQLLDLAEPEQSAFINELAASNPELAARVTQLLQAARVNAGDHFLEPSASAGTRPERSHPTACGNYQILHPLATGATCSVYLASQLRPVRRLVALKLLHGTTAHADTQQRFAAEQEALASLQHPNIAQFFEAGVSDARELFFAMEYVDGPSITEHAHTHTTARADRLRLFIQVCDAVAYAHRRGVIHRDLKPSNILVSATTSHRPLAKVIDFGIAKVLQPTQDHTVTHPGLLLGTLAYMSPEQLRGDSRAIDTRTDIFSLGLILFEMLTGEPPFDPAAGISGLPGMRASADRPTALPPRPKLLGAELTSILAKSTAADPADRYQSVGEFAADIENFLASRPVHAARGSAWYRAVKLIRRHRAISAAAVLVLIVTIIAAILSARARHQRATLAVNLANAWLSQALSMGRNLGDTAHRGPALRRLLEEGNRLHELLPGDPGVQSMLAAAHAELGYALLERRENAEAVRQFEAALAIRRSFAEDEPRNPANQRELSLALVRLGDAQFASGNAAEGEKLYRQALDIDEQLARAAPNDPAALSNLGWSYERLSALTTTPADRADLATRQLEVFTRRRDVIADTDSLRGISSASHNLAQARRDQGQPFADQASNALTTANQALELAPSDRILLLTRLRALVAFAESRPTHAERVAAIIDAVTEAQDLVGHHPDDADALSHLVGALYRATLLIPADAINPADQALRSSYVSQLQLAIARKNQ